MKVAIGIAVLAVICTVVWIVRLCRELKRDELP